MIHFARSAPGRFAGIALAAVLLLAGCSAPSGAPGPMPVGSAPPPPPPPPPPVPVAVESNPNVAKGNEFDQVRVFFATDRKADAEGNFGGERGSEVSYGSIFVSIPREHRVGAIEKPSIWRLEFSEDPRKHMMITRQSVTDRDDFFADLKATLARGGSQASFLFVHGYNVAFEVAAKRTAQITYDLDFRGAPVFYSWPSQGSLQGYPTDENNVQWSEANLKRFLLDYAQNSGAKDIYLIAHSMGNRALTGAVNEAALFGLREIVVDTPIDTGRARASWEVTLADGTAHDSAGLGLTGPVGSRQASRDAGRARAGKRGVRRKLDLGGGP